MPVCRNEMELKDYIAERPDSLLGQPLIVIKRESSVSHGRYFDILALNGDHELVVVEVKNDHVGRDVVTQALEYAAGVVGWTADDIEREYGRYHPPGVTEIPPLADEFERKFAREFHRDQLDGNKHRIVLVGHQFDPATGILARYLDSHTVPVQLISYEAKHDTKGLAILFAPLGEVKHGGDHWRGKRQLDAPLGEKRRLAQMPMDSKSVFQRLTELVKQGLPKGAYIQHLELNDVASGTCCYYFWPEIGRRFSIPVKLYKKNGTLSVRAGCGAKKGSPFQTALYNEIARARPAIETCLGNDVRILDKTTLLEDDVVIDPADVESASDRVLAFRRALDGPVRNAAKAARL